MTRSAAPQGVPGCWGRRRERNAGAGAGAGVKRARRRGGGTKILRCPAGDAAARSRARRIAQAAGEAKVACPRRGGGPVPAHRLERALLRVKALGPHGGHRGRRRCLPGLRRQRCCCACWPGGRHSSTFGRQRGSRRRGRLHLWLAAAWRRGRRHHGGGGLWATVGALAGVNSCCRCVVLGAGSRGGGGEARVSPVERLLRMLRVLSLRRARRRALLALPMLPQQAIGRPGVCRRRGPRALHVGLGGARLATRPTCALHGSLLCCLGPVTGGAWGGSGVGVGG